MTIYIAGNLIDLPLYKPGHLQLVRDDMEYEVQMPLPQGPFGSWVVQDVQAHVVPEGATIGDPATYTAQALVLGNGVSEDGVWSIFEQAKETLQEYQIDYDADFNSNSYINTLLKLIGHSTAEYTIHPTDVNNGFPGQYEDAATREEYNIFWDIVGSDGRDILHGGNGNDLFLGKGGVDFLDGGKGSDQLSASERSFPGAASDNVADYLTGGEGADQFFVANSHSNEQLFVYDFDAGDYVYNQNSRATYDLVRDFSSTDTIAFSLDEFWEDIFEVGFSGYTLEESGNERDGKTIYDVTGWGSVSPDSQFLLRAIKDSYYDENLGESVDVTIFCDGETYAPIFALEQGGFMLS